MTLLAAALAYAQKFSIHVFPLAPHSKVPHGRLAPTGFKSATVDLARIKRWWSESPESGVGIACALSGFVVIDVDPRNGGDDTLGALERDLGPLPRTWTSLTGGGGQQFFFRDTVGDYAATLGEGIDLKFNGYVVAPPSTHPNGATYRWDAGGHPSDTEVAALPGPWLDRATKRAQSTPGLDTSGEDAAKSFLGAAFAHLGWLGDSLPEGKRMVRCPWQSEHTDGRGDGKDSSTVIFPRALGRTMGGFRCAHSHCAARTWKDVMAALPHDAQSAGHRLAQTLGRPSIWEEAC